MRSEGPSSDGEVCPWLTISDLRVVTRRFNIYLVLGCLGRFSQTFYKRWGKAFVMGAREAIRNRKIRVALADSTSSGTIGTSSSSGAAGGSARLRVGPNPRFAPLGTTPHVPDHANAFGGGHAAASMAPLSLISPTYPRRKGGKSGRVAGRTSPPVSPTLARRLFNRDEDGGSADDAPSAGHYRAGGAEGVTRPNTARPGVGDGSGAGSRGEAASGIAGKTSSFFATRIGLHAKGRNSRRYSTPSALSTGSEHGVEEKFTLSAFRDEGMEDSERPAAPAPAAAGASELRHRRRSAGEAEGARGSSGEGEGVIERVDGDELSPPPPPPVLSSLPRGQRSVCLPGRGRLRVRWGRVSGVFAVVFGVVLVTVAWLAGYRFVPSHIDGVGWAQTVPVMAVRTVTRWAPSGRQGWFSPDATAGSRRDVFGRGAGDATVGLDLLPPGIEAELAAGTAAATRG